MCSVKCIFILFFFSIRSAKKKKKRTDDHPLFYNYFVSAREDDSCVRSSIYYAYGHSVHTKKKREKSCTYFFFFFEFIQFVLLSPADAWKRLQTDLRVDDIVVWRIKKKIVCFLLRSIIIWLKDLVTSWAKKKNSLCLPSVIPKWKIHLLPENWSVILFKIGK